MRRQNFFWILTLFLVFVLQVAVADNIAIAGVAPNLFMLSTIFFAIRGGAMAGAVLGFVFGLVSDATNITLFGSQTFMMTLIGTLAGRLTRKVDEEKYSAQMVLVFLMSLANFLGLLFLESLFGGNARRYRDWAMILSPIYSTLLCPVFFWGLLQWSALFRRRTLRDGLL